MWAICDAFFNQTELLEDLFSYFEKDPPLNPLLASYTSRVAGVLLQKKTVDVRQHLRLAHRRQMVAYLKERKNIINTFLKHIGNVSIIDLLLKIIGSDDLAEGTGVLEVRICLCCSLFSSGSAPPT